MFLSFPSIQVPDLLTRLCTLQLKETRKSHASIFSMIEKDAFVCQLTLKILDCRSIDQAEKVLAQKGWKYLRDRLASAYIHYMRYKKFPEAIDDQNVKDICQFESKLGFLINETDSRLFLFGFYLRLCDISQGQYDKDLELSGQTIKSLKLGKSRLEKPDWLLVMILLMENVLGDLKLYDLLVKGKGSMSHIFADFDDQDFNYFIGELLKYGQAIDDKEFFLFNKV